MPASKAAQQNKLRNKIIARIGWLSAMPGSTPESVSKAMDGVVSPDEVAQVWKECDFAPSPLQTGYSVVPVALAAKHRTKLAIEGTARGLELPDMAAALLGKTAQDQLFGALLDG